MHTFITRIVLRLFAMGFLVLGGIACSTAPGFCQDMEKAG